MSTEQRLHHGRDTAESRCCVGGLWRKTAEASPGHIGLQKTLVAVLPCVDEVFLRGGCLVASSKGRTSRASTLHTMYRQLLTIPYDADQHVPLSVNFARCPDPICAMCHAPKAETCTLRACGICASYGNLGRVLCGCCCSRIAIMQSCSMVQLLGCYTGYVILVSFQIRMALRKVGSAWCDFAVERPAWAL